MAFPDVSRGQIPFELLDDVLTTHRVRRFSRQAALLHIPEKRENVHFAGVAGSIAQAFGAIYKFDQAFTNCTTHNDMSLVNYAFGVGSYIQANAARFGQAGQDMATYYGVYLAGGATAAEFLGACFATLSVGDWALILAAVGLTAWQVASQIRCYAVAYNSP